MLHTSSNRRISSPAKALILCAAAAFGSAQVAMTQTAAAPMRQDDDGLKREAGFIGLMVFGDPRPIFSRTMRTRRPSHSSSPTRFALLTTTREPSLTGLGHTQRALV